jgi:N-acetylglucosamine-6-phosphate deacetylase
MVELAFAAAGDRVVLVSDMAAVTSVDSGGHLAVGPDGGLRLANGTLAGSSVGLGEAVERAATWGIPAEMLLKAASHNPNQVVRRFAHLDLAVGKVADFVALNDELQVCRTWVGGAVAHDL